MMDMACKEKIRENLVYLVNELEVDDLLDRMEQEKAFTSEHCAIVRSEKTPQNKARTFLRILKCRGSNGFSIFLTAVRETQPHIAQHLEGSRQVATGTEGVCLKTLTIEDLQRWLEPVLDAKEIAKDTILPLLSKAKINGETFAEMDKDDFKEVFPELAFGEMRRLVKIRDENLSTPLVLPKTCNTPIQEEGLENEDVAVTSKEYFRKFGRTPGMTEKYYRGSQMEDFQKRPGNLLDPIHRCIHISTQSPPDLLAAIGKETVEFASACMNDRTNGIIHVGIGDGKPNSPPLGEVAGITVDSKACGETILQWMKDYFSEDQLSVAVKCIREAKFIDVIDRSKKRRSDLVVVEIDVEPCADLVKDAAFFLEFPKGDGTKELKLFSNKAGDLQPMDQRDLMHFMETKSALTAQRKQKESEGRQKNKDRTLREKIVDLLYRGSDRLNSDLYHILVANRLEETLTPEQMKESFGFLEKFDWRCIFDFDPYSSSEGLYHFLAQEQKIVYKIKTTDDFDIKKCGDGVEESEMQEALDDLKASAHNSWVFCNGDGNQDIEAMDVGRWEVERAEGFKECLRFFYREIPEERAVVVFLLLSKNYEVMMETAKEFILKFPNQWVILAETETIANDWVRHVLQTVRQVSAETIADRCIVMHAWKDINEVVLALAGRELRPDDCLIPSSTGANVVLSKHKRQMWHDLEIVGPSECKPDESQTPEQLDEKRKEEEDKFYVGCEASWWNFYFQDHVLTRERYQVLVKLVRESLDTCNVDFDRSFNTVAIYHQPGSGGTTLAKKVIWDLREEYRCCVLNRVTKSTAQQIIELREYGEREESDVKPVLVLIDNQDDENIDLLLENLKQQVKDRGIQDLVCTFLFCYRRAALPLETEKKKFILEQKLSRREQDWFLMRYKELMELYKRGRSQGLHPDMLLVLNIMKVNYDQEATERTVSTFVEEIRTYQERTLLKYVSMLNSYDAKFRGIPVPFFDYLMRWARWETSLSSQVCLFLTFFTKPQVGGYTLCLRTANSLLCRYILNAILKGENQTPADAFEEFLHLPVLKSPWKTPPLKEVLDIIKTILKQREWQKTLSTFSRLVQELFDAQHVDAAAAILKTGFELTNDAKIAQQIARLYISCQKWDEALYYANEATRRCPMNSYLWDTHGQIFKAQLADIQKSTGGRVGERTISEVVEIAFEGVQRFRKVQQLSRNETTFPPNTSGHFGELDSVRSLLEILRSLPSLRERSSMASFMQSMSVPEELKGLTESQIKWLKELKDQVFVTLRSLEDEASRANVENYAGNRRALMILQSRDLDKIHYQLCKHFGEEPLKDIRGIELMDPQTRRRHAFQLRGISLLSMLRQMREKEEEGARSALMVLHLMRLNLQGNSREPQDLHMGLTSSLALISWQRSSGLPVSYEDLLHWGFAYHGCSEPVLIDLDRYMFMVVLHWPTDERREALRPGFLASIPFLTKALDQWKEDYMKKCPSDQHRQEDSIPLFFLTQNPGLDSVVHVDFLKKVLGVMKKGRKHKQMQQGIFRSRWARGHLKRFKGTLLRLGQELQMHMQTSEGNTINLIIPLLTREVNSDLWRKHVYFVLGFSRSGPMACDVADENIGGGDSNPGSSSPRFQPPMGHFPCAEGAQEKDLRIKLLELENLKLRMGQGYSPTAAESHLLRQESSLRQQAKFL